MVASLLRLPDWLRQPLAAGVMTPAEALGIWAVWLQTTEGQSLPLPQNLWPAASRLHLWEMPASPTRH